MRTAYLTASTVIAALSLVSAGQLQAQTNTSDAGQRLATVNRDPYPSTYVPRPAQLTALIGATVLDGAGGMIENGTIIMSDGKIMAAGADVDIPAGATMVNANGKWVTSGIIDIHSHIGIGPVPNTEASGDVNEATSPNTAQVWTEHAVWPQALPLPSTLRGLL